MPFIKEKFTSYSDFANASLKDIYGEKLNNSYEKEATQFKSILIINQGNETFKTNTLPNEAQQFPIMRSAFYDINNDGYDDCILSGNIFNTEVETPRLDAISGTVLLSNKKDGYNFINYPKSGLYLEGNSKDIIITKFAAKPLIISTKNNDKLGVYQIKSN